MVTWVFSEPVKKTLNYLLLATGTLIGFFHLMSTSSFLTFGTFRRNGTELNKQFFRTLDSNHWEPLVFIAITTVSPFRLKKKVEFCWWVNQWIANFIVTGGNEAGVDVDLIQPFPLYYVNHVVLVLTSIFQAQFQLQKEGGLYQNKVNLSLTFTQRVGY